MKLTSIAAAGAVALVLSVGTAAEAAVVLAFGENSTSSNPTPTGASGTATLTFTDEGGDVRVTVDVENTTGDTIFGDGATQATLTGVGFDLVSGATYAGGFVAGTYLDTLIQDADASPYGTLDVAGADNTNFNGGNANDGLPTGFSDMFSFVLSYAGSALDLENAFYDAFTTNPVLTSVMRFMQVNAGAGSDKLTNPDVLPPVPLPAAGWFLVAGLGGLLAFGRKKQQA